MVSFGLKFKVPERYKKTTLKSFRNVYSKKWLGKKKNDRITKKREKMAIVQRLYLIGQIGQRCIFEMFNFFFDVVPDCKWYI